VFYLRGGTYYDYITFQWSGTADNPITIQAYPGEHVVFDGSLVPHNHDNPWSNPYIEMGSMQPITLPSFKAGRTRN